MGIIYKIWTADSNKIYIGSTIQTKEERFEDHKKQFYRYSTGYSNKKIASFQILSYGNSQIDVLEEVENDEKDALLIRERFYYDLYKDRAVNTRRPYLYPNEKRIRKK